MFQRLSGLRLLRYATPSGYNWVSSDHDGCDHVHVGTKIASPSMFFDVLAVHALFHQCFRGCDDNQSISELVKLYAFIWAVLHSMPASTTRALL